MKKLWLLILVFLLGCAGPLKIGTNIFYEIDTLRIDNNLPFVRAMCDSLYAWSDERVNLPKLFKKIEIEKGWNPATYQKVKEIFIDNVGKLSTHANLKETVDQVISMLNIEGK